MYRADRYSQTSHADRGPVVFTACAAAVLFIAIACGVGGDKKKSDMTVATPNPPAVAQPPVAGEVIDPGHGVPRNVTFASAEAAYAKGRYREAVESFDVYVQRRPDNAFGHYMLGLSAWKSGDGERARAAFERSLELDSTNVKTLLNLGRVLLEQGRPDDALVRVGAAIEIDSGLAEARRMMGRVQTARGQRDSAMTSYRVALSLDPADSWSMNNLGLVLIEQGRYAEALLPLARAVELRPDAPAFANNLGVALERTGHLGAAADAFRAALKADSSYAKASRSLARVDGKSDDSTAVDLHALAETFNQEIQVARQARLMAKAVAKPDSVQPPER
jgi:Tfp pilus assembly protein PilF